MNYNNMQLYNHAVKMYCCSTKTAKIPQKKSDYFKMGDNLVCRRVKSAKPVTRSGSGLQQVQFRDFVVVSNFHKHFSPGNYAQTSVLRGSGSSDY